MLLAMAHPFTPTGKGRPSFILHTITGFHRLGLYHYYGLICHLTPTPILSLLLNRCFQSYTGLDARLPQLLHWLPVRDPTLKHGIGLTEYWASRYFARLPTY